MHKMDLPGSEKDYSSLWRFGNNRLYWRREKLLFCFSSYPLLQLLMEKNAGSVIKSLKCGHCSLYVTNWLRQARLCSLYW